jgi:NADPH:quinone reductase-like Zn-dependent oxidoreductase
MKAIVNSKYGSPDVLQIQDVSKPIPRDNEILVRVMAATVNRTDCANLSARPFIMRFTLGLFKPKKQISGTEFAGVVEATGKNVTSFAIGDQIFGFNDGILSSYAEYLTISEDMGLATMPKNISFAQAAASSEGVHYAYNFINKVPLKSGDRVLVNGADGGIGSATVQLLKYFGAEITAVCQTKNMALLKSLGSDTIIDYTKEDFTKVEAKYDYVFDTVGKSSFGKCSKILKPGGAYISSELGRYSQNVFLSLITAIFGSIPGQEGKKVKFPYPPDIRRSVLFIKKLIEEGKYSPVIDRTYPLSQIAEAFRYVEKGQKTGNVVITIKESL